MVSRQSDVQSMDGSSSSSFLHMAERQNRYLKVIAYRETVFY